jgi:hypothetical protein
MVDFFIKLDQSDRLILRNLAKRVAELAAMPEMARRRELWIKHNGMDRSVRPVVYINPERSWEELVQESSLSCQGELCRTIERNLKQRIYAAERFAGDNVLEKEWVVPKVIHNPGWGLTAQRKHADQIGGAFGFEPVIKEASDIKKLRIPEITYDEAETLKNLNFFTDLFGDILEIKLKGITDLSYHLMNQYSGLRGLQELLIDMIDNPQMVHDAMAFFEEGHHQIMRQYIAQDLLGANNDNTGLYTSGHGYTDEPPKQHGVLPGDLWGWAEAQEMAAASPEMHQEFAFPYEKRLLEPFKLNGYGCCDPVDNKLDFVLKTPNLRRVSVSPWANVNKCAEQIKDKAIMLWKPNPAHLVGNFAPDMVRSYLRQGIAAARDNGCVLEIALFDTHTCENHPERFDQWAEIAHQEVTD